MNLKKRNPIKSEMSQHSKIKQLLKTAVKIIIAAAALWLVFQSIDIREVWTIGIQIHPAFLIGAILLFILSKIFAALRLNVFFKKHELRIPEKENLKLYWLGMFYNLFLPGGISGDGYKIYLLKKQTDRNLKELFTAIFIDRISGVAVLASMAVLLISFADTGIPLLHWSWILLLPILVGFFLFFYFFFKRYIDIFLPIVSYSFLVQGLQVVEVWLLLKGLGIEQMELAYLFVFLFSSLVAIIPVSIGGMGTRELAFLYGAQFLGLSEAASVTVSLLFYAITLLVSLGGAGYSIAPQKIKIQYDKKPLKNK
jgi:hypothetical protein